jgi:hypothetical protein
VRAADVLSDKGEQLQEVASNTVRELKKPANSAIAGASTVAVLSIITHPHETFQFLGFVGLELSLLRALLGYESPVALVRDWSDRAQEVAKAASGVTGTAAAAVKKVAAATIGETAKEEVAPKEKVLAQKEQVAGGKLSTKSREGAV